MKNILIYLLAGALGFGAAYAFVSYRKDSQRRIELANAEAGWKAQISDLNAALTAANAKAAQAPAVVTKIVTERIADTNYYSPKEILERLISLDPNLAEGSRNRTYRKIIGQFQRLTDCGADAIPAIRDFLSQNQDVYYSSGDLSPSGERTGQAMSSLNPTRTDFLVPPSLRLGLLDGLQQIGGPDAEAVLASVLATTGRGVEVAYLAQILEQIAPEKYCAELSAAAKELLLHPPEITAPNLLDRNARSFLYKVLKRCGDTTYLEEAQAKLVSEDGQLDRTTAHYLTSVLNEEALPSLMATYSQLKNPSDKHAVVKEALEYVGGQEQANDLFALAVGDETLPLNLRSFIIMSLSGGHRDATPNSPELIQGRMELLMSLKASTQDPTLVRSIDETQVRMQELLRQKDIANQKMQEAASQFVDPAPIELEQ